MKNLTYLGGLSGAHARKTAEAETAGELSYHLRQGALQDIETIWWAVERVDDAGEELGKVAVR